MPVGVVMRREPGVTRWATVAWRAVALLPGAGPADWRELRREGDVVEYHAGSPTLTLYPAEAEAYAHELGSRTPSLYAILRRRPSDHARLDLVAITASPYEGQDYADSGEEIVERIGMPAPLLAWVEAFTHEHHHEEAFVKRRRDRARIDRVEDGIGDPRISQASDVYRAPTRHGEGAK